jgi:putative transposase
MVRCTGAQGWQDLLLTCVRRSVADPVRDRQAEDLRQGGGVAVDHATINRWGLQYSPAPAAAFRRRQRLVRSRWRREEPDLKVEGPWCSLSRAGDQAGQTVDCRRTAPRDAQAAPRSLSNAIRRPGVPAMLTMAGSGAHAAAIRGDHERPGTALISRPGTSRTQAVARDQRAVKRGRRPMRGCTACAAARWPRAGVGRRPLVKQGPPAGEAAAAGRTPAEPVSAVAASSPAPQGAPRQPSHFATDPVAHTAGVANGERVRRWFQEKNAGWYAVLEDSQMPVTSTLLDQAHNAIERKLFAMTGFHHPKGSQQALLTGLAHLYNLVPYRRRAKHAGQCGMEVEGGRVPTPDRMLNLQILTSGGFR